jgi:hypothetical protein
MISRTKLGFRLVLILIGLWLAFELVSRVAAEILWFQEVNYFSVLIKRWQTQLFLFIFTCGISCLFLLGNLFIANRLAWRWLPEAEGSKQGFAYLPKISRKKEIGQQNTYRSNYLSSIETERASTSDLSSPPIKLPLLLPLVLISCLFIAVRAVSYTRIAYSIWQPDYRLPRITTTLPSAFPISSFPQLVDRIQDYVSQYLWQSVVIGIIVIVTFVFLSVIATLWLEAIAIFYSLIFGSIVAGNWTIYLQYLQPTSFNFSDPQFNHDISFYIFIVPVWKWLNFWLIGLFAEGLLGCFLVYILSGNSLSEGRFPGFSRLQLRHLSFLAAAQMLALAAQHWLNRYNLLYSERGVTYGASYTDVRIQLPLETILCLVAIAIALGLTIKGFIYKNQRIKKINLKKRLKFPFLVLTLGIYLLLLIGGNLTAEAVQRLVVEPNELERELPYLKRNIGLTRNAFGLEAIEARTFVPRDVLTAADLERNNLTIDNIRLWDTRPILQTNRQLQQIRLYYKFPDADIDRYIFERAEAEEDNSVAANRRQVIISPRELDFSAVPERAQTWVNEHLIYTHGYGFTLSPVNQVDTGGLPFYYVQDIGTGPEEEGTLRTSSQLIRDNIPIGNPRIYFGELTDTYVMAPTREAEFDFPSGDENVYNHYDGTGGINIGNYGRRLLFAQYLKNWQMLFTRNFTPDTKLLFRRNITRRVWTIAPFLRYDRDPYLVVADTGNPIDKKVGNYLYWIIDAYTTSDRYPYSDPGNNGFNYIRNSVKVVVNAYNGNVDFYVADPNDPIIQTWSKIFPELFKPLEAMPANLFRHIRYPQDLFSTQSERLLTYHMTDPQVFYNREDQWQIPQEIYGTESQAVKPYYLIMRLPTAIGEEFILLNPFTPISRPNLIAWLAARSDGEQYGKLLLYQFPKQVLIYGPNQIEALINQDPVISQQISLWNREGSRAIQGNLLIIPIEQSLLYVEPLYLEAERNSLPTLVRVIVVYQNQIVMAETLEEAIQAIFAPLENDNGTIIRPVDDLAPLVPEVPAEGNDREQPSPTELEQ